MKKSLLIASGLLVLLIAVLPVSLPYLLPTTTFKSFLTERAQATIGRQLRIDGAVHWQLVPQIEVRAENMYLDNADWSKEAEMLQIGMFELHLSLPALLQSRLEVRKLSVSDARIALETSASGQNNWEFSTERTAKTHANVEQKPGVPAFSIHDVSIDDTWIIIDNQQLGSRREITDFQLTVPQFRHDAPLQITGAFTLDGNTSTLEAQLADPEAFADHRNSDISLHFEIPDIVHADLEGNLLLGSDWMQTRGDLSVKLDIPHIGPDIRELLVKFAPATHGIPTHIAHLESVNLQGAFKKIQNTTGHTVT